ERTDLAVGARGGIVLCDISIARSGTTRPLPAKGRLHVEIKDAQTGQAIPARLGLYDTTGRTPLPSDQALMIHRYADDRRVVWVAPRLVWPSTERQAFYVDGSYDSEVPAGSYNVVATRGPEYRVFTSTVDVKAGQANRAVVSLQRYIDQPSRGWY